MLVGFGVGAGQGVYEGTISSQHQDRDKCNIFCSL